MKIKELIKILRKEGWKEVRRKGSHRQFKHPEKEGLITVPDHGKNEELAKGTQHSIFKQAGLK